jgi:putative membrane protein
MKLHPLSIPFRVVSRGVNLAGPLLIGAVAFSGGDPVMTAGIVVLGVVALAALVAWEVAYYRRFEYELTRESLDIHSGVFSRREREIPLRRVQNVDVTRSFVARLLGLAEVDVETAGGGSTEANLRFVSREEAERLQTEVRERRAKLRKREADESGATGEEAAAEDGEEAAEAVPEEETLFELSQRDLALYGILSFDPRLLSGVAALIPFLAPALDGTGGIQTLGWVVLGVVAALGALVLWAVSAAARMVRFYGFRLWRVGDDLRYERGLFQRRDGTIPLSKLQTVAVEDNVLMRRYDFASLAVETAGYSPGSSPSGGSEAAIPLASREDVLDLARTLEPFDDVDLSRPPERARKRYVRRYLIVGALAIAAGFLVSRFVVAFPWYALLPLLALAWPAATRAHATRGYDLGSSHVVTQKGFWRRSTRVVPYDRVQTVIRRQTIFQQRWDLASVVVDTAGSRSISTSDATAVDRDVEEADELVGDVRDATLASVGGGRESKSELESTFESESEADSESHTEEQS